MNPLYAALMLLLILSCSSAPKKDDTLKEPSVQKETVSDKTGRTKNSLPDSEETAEPEAPERAEVPDVLKDPEVKPEELITPEEAEKQKAGLTAEQLEKEEQERIRIEKKIEEERLRREEELKKQREEEERIRKEQEELERLRIEKEKEEEEKRRRLERLNRIDPERNYFFRKEASENFSGILEISLEEDEELILAGASDMFSLHGNASIENIQTSKSSSARSYGSPPEEKDLTQDFRSMKGNFVLLLKKKGEGKFRPLVLKKFWKKYRILNVYSEGKDLILIDAEETEHPHAFYRWSAEKIILKKD